MELQRIDLATHSIVPDDFPFVSGVMRLPPETWADLTLRGYPGVGYWPVVDQQPAYDPTKQTLGAASLAVDAPNQRVVRTWAVVVLPVIVPQSVSRFQALAALSNAGLLTQAQNAVAASTNPLVPLAWNNAQTFDRGSATVAALGPALGLTDAQIDSLFIAASTITA